MNEEFRKLMERRQISKNPPAMPGKCPEEPIKCDRCRKQIPSGVPSYYPLGDNKVCPDCFKTEMKSIVDSVYGQAKCPDCERDQAITDTIIIPYHMRLREENKGLKKLVLLAWKVMSDKDRHSVDGELRDLFLDIQHEAEQEKNQGAARLDAERELKETLDLLLQVMLKATNDCDDDNYDRIFSHGNGHYEDAIRLLAEHGKVAILNDAPFNLIAREITEKKEEVG